MSSQNDQVHPWYWMCECGWVSKPTLSQRPMYPPACGRGCSGVEMTRAIATTIDFNREESTLIGHLLYRMWAHGKHAADEPFETVEGLFLRDNLFKNMQEHFGDRNDDFMAMWEKLAKAGVY